MADYTFSGDDAEFLDEIRSALANIDATRIPDETILQQRDRVTAPHLNDELGADQQGAFDDALIVYTAEKAFDSWMTKTRFDDADLQIKVNPTQYREGLKERTDDVFERVGVSRPGQRPTVSFRTL